MRINRRLMAGIGATAIGAAVPALALAFAVSTASADTPGSCQEGSPVNCVTPSVPLCPAGDDHRGPLCVYVGGAPSDRDLHAAARVSGLVCVHAIVGNNDIERRDLIRTESCSSGVAVVPPCSCATPVPAAPPAVEAPGPVDTAPAPTVVNNNTNTSGSPLPAVTH